RLLRLAATGVLRAAREGHGRGNDRSLRHRLPAVPAGAAAGGGAHVTAAVMTPAEQAGVVDLTPQLVSELMHRVANDGERWLEQVGGTGYCSHPIRLSGSVHHVDRATGEV